MVRMYTSIVFVTLFRTAVGTVIAPVRMYTSIVFVILFRTAVGTVIAWYVCTLVLSL